MATANIQFVGSMNPENLTGERIDYLYNGTLYVGSVAAKLIVDADADFDDIPTGVYPPGTKVYSAASLLTNTPIAVVDVDGTFVSSDDVDNDDNLA